MSKLIEQPVSSGIIRAHSMIFYEPNRKVGPESRKTYQKKIFSGFFDKYMQGSGLDVGYKGYEEDDSLPILPTAIGLDKDTPGYDGMTFPYKLETFDYVYTSHTLEHMEYAKNFITECFRVLKPKGHLIIVVPHRDLYEKKTTYPSRWNPDHKHFFTPGTLLNMIELALPINSYRVRHLQDNDEGHNYQDPPDKHANWEYEIEVVLQKL